MKKRTIALMLSVLAVLMLVGVGFATWVISNGDAKDVSGQLVVDTVRDDRLNITVTALDDGNFNFTAPATTPTGWLKAEGTYESEKKQIQFEVKVARQDGEAFADLTDVDFSAALKEGTTDTISSLNLIKQATPYITVSANEFVDSSTKLEIKCTVTVAYEWGELFNGENPYDFFNGFEVTDTISAEVYALAAAAGLQYKGAAIAATANYGDLAFAALQKLSTLTGTIQVTIGVELH